MGNGSPGINCLVDYYYVIILLAAVRCLPKIYIPGVHIRGRLLLLVDVSFFIIILLYLHFISVWDRTYFFKCKNKDSETLS